MLEIIEVLSFLLYADHHVKLPSAITRGLASRNRFREYLLNVYRKFDPKNQGNYQLYNECLLNLKVTVPKKKKKRVMPSSIMITLLNGYQKVSVPKKK